MKKRKIALIVTVIILVLLLAAVLIVPRVLAMAVYRENFGVRFTSYEPLTWDMDDFDGLMRDKHTFPSDKGQMLTGYTYYRGNADAKGLVVLAHGFGGGGHRHYLHVANFFAESGYRVFAYDATGNDESEGEAVGGLPQGVIDLDYALRYVKGQAEFEGMPIFLWGHSWGGYSAGSVVKRHPDVKGVVIVAGFNESLDMLETEGRNIAGDAIEMVLPFFEKHERKMFGDYAGMSVLEGLEGTDAAVMVIHSADDSMIPIDISFDRYYEKFGACENFTFIRFEDRGHNYLFCSPDRLAYVDAYNAEADRYRQSVGELTEEMRAAYYEAHFDKHKGYALDEELMMQMVAMFDRCVN